MYTLGRTPESILHSIDTEDIPVKLFHTLFFPGYFLDARLHSAGRYGPPKWEARSRIVMYLVHFPFRAGIMSLVWNPTTDRVSPQYHVVFNDNFTTVQYMGSGTIPTNWEDLATNLSEKATPNDVDLADSWVNG